MTRRSYTTTPETDAALQAGLDDHNARLGSVPNPDQIMEEGAEVEMIPHPAALADASAFFVHLVDSQMAQIVAQYGKTVNADADKVEAALAEADPEVQAAFAKLRAAALA